MPFFPMFVNIEDEKIIVLGGGNAALKKVYSLINFGCRIAVIAPRICDELKAIRGISVHEMNLTLDVLDNAYMVVAATNRPEVNDKIGRYCLDRNIPVNVADNPALSSFLFPGVIYRDELVLGITTGGCSPSVSKEVKKLVERAIPQEFGPLTRKMAYMKEQADYYISDSTLREMALDDMVKSAAENRYVLDDKHANKILDRYIKEDKRRKR